MVTVKVPATTANIGPGFDCLGAALSLYNEFTFKLTESQSTFNIIGAESAKLHIDKDNLLWQSWLKFHEYIGQTAGNVEIYIKLEVPLARGLGSSATAIIGGLVGANYLAGNPLNTQQLIDLAISIEGHPDNVVPALLGNCQLSVFDGKKWQICPIPWHPDVIPVLAIPNFELSTEKARAVLPTQISRSDAIFNTAHLGLLLQALATGNRDWLTAAMADKIHQPYRESLIMGYPEVREAAINAGAYGVVISGAGPTILALTNPSQASEVIKAMKQAWESQNILTNVKALTIDDKGAQIVEK